VSFLKKKSFWIFILLLSVGIGVYYFYFKKDQASDVKYREVTVSKGSVRDTILATGTVQPENRLEIKPPIPGRVEEIVADEGQRVTKGQILAWMSSTERAALLDAARAKGPAELKHWEDYYKATPILAPIDGMIILRSLQAGQTFTGTDAVYVMSDRLTVKAQVDETDIAKIKMSQKAQIVLDAYPNETLPGHVDRIAYDATIVNNVTNYIVDVLPEQTPDFMRSGMTANVTFVVATRENILVLPKEAVKSKGNHSYVLVSNPDDPKKPKQQDVELGLSDGKQVEITSGLSEGEVVLMSQGKRFDATKSTLPTNPFAPGGRPRPH
jgi:macrolide-specific efflux system membrane fusion protein